MASEERHVYGPRPVSALIPALTRPAFRRRAPSTTQILADWPIIIGPALAAVTTPQRLSAGTLTLACSGPVAMELQHLAAEVIDRINTHLGREAVRALRFVQTMPPPAGREAPRAASVPVPEIAGIPPGELRDALAALGQAVASEQVSTRLPRKR